MKSERILLRWLAAGWLLLLLMATFAPTLLASNDPLALDLTNRLEPPGTLHWAGTDALGRDMLARVTAGARFTVFVTIGATLLAVSLGLLLGAIAGWYGGWVGQIVQFVINLFWSIPFVALVILVLAVVGVSLGSLILAIGGINWVVSARVFRAEIERLRRSEFVRGTRALGFSSQQLLKLHITPHLWPLVGRLAVFGAIETLTLETGLAFLGLSLPPPLPTWGGLLAEGLEQMSSAWWVPVIPGVTVLLTLVSLRALSSERTSPAVI
jgi:peptide/nickel transport system permease protein